MQKKIIAAAVAGALASPLAFAQSTVTIYGAFDMSIANSRYSSSPTSSSVSKMDVYNQSSRFGLRGEENLGGGLRAWFQAEQNIQADSGRNNNTTAGIGSRNTGLGLTGGWGTVMLGFWDTPYKVSILGTTGMSTVGGLPGHNGVTLGNSDSSGSNPNQNCDNIVATGAVTTAVCGNGQEAGATQFHRRAANVIQYWSPKFGGFDFRFALSANEEKATNAATFNNNPRLWSVSGTYASGPWFGTIAYEQHRGFRDTAAAASTVNTKDKGWLLGGGYNFGVAAVNLGYERLVYGNAMGNGAVGTDNSYRRPSWFVGVAVPMGPAGSAIRAGYSRMSGNKNCGAGTVCGSTTGLRAFTLGYEYALSKRSAAYVNYGKVTNNAASAAVFNVSPPGPNGNTSAIGAGADQTWLGVGMKHTF
jgi:predicted porin